MSLAFVEQLLLFFVVLCVCAYFGHGCSGRCCTVYLFGVYMLSMLPLLVLLRSLLLDLTVLLLVSYVAAITFVLILLCCCFRYF